VSAILGGAALIILGLVVLTEKRAIAEWNDRARTQTPFSNDLGYRVGPSVNTRLPVAQR